MRLGLDRNFEADRARDPARLRPDRHGRGLAADPAYAFAAEPDASTTRSPAGGAGASRLRPVERHEVGAERVDRPAPRALCRQRRARGRRDAGTRPAGRPVRTRGARTQARSRDARSVSAVPGPTAATFGRFSAAPRDLVGAVRARHDRPVVAGAVDRLVGDALDLDQRAFDHLVPERLEPLDERARLRARAGDDHPSGALAAERTLELVDAGPLCRRLEQEVGQLGGIGGARPLEPGAVGGRDQGASAARRRGARRPARGSRRRAPRRRHARRRHAGASRRRRHGRQAPSRPHAPGARRRPAPPRAASSRAAAAIRSCRPDQAGRGRRRRARARRGRARPACADACRCSRAAARRRASARERAAGRGGARTPCRCASRAGARPSPTRASLGSSRSR